MAPRRTFFHTWQFEAIDFRNWPEISTERVILEGILPMLTLFDEIGSQNSGDDDHLILEKHGYDVDCKVVTVTPQMAEEWLASAFIRGVNNDSLVVQYALSMEKDEWLLTGETLIINKANQLVDGRKRLLACIRAQKPFKTLVVFGTDVDTEGTIDDRRKRTFADVLMIEGQHSYRTLSKIIEILWRMRDGTWRATRVDNQQRLAFLRKNSDIARSLNITRGLPAPLQRSVFAAAHFLFSRVHPAQADEFIRSICDYETLPRESPELILYNRFLSMKENRIQHNRATAQKKLALVIKAWNAKRTGTTIKQTHYGAKENFPSIHGWTQSCSIPTGEVSALEASEFSEDRITARVEMITPDIAANYLECNTNNRNASWRTVDKYSHALKEDQWRLNGETIKFDSTGKLIDGQHRLKACMESGFPILTIVVRGLSPVAFQAIDQGQVRSFSEILEARKYRQPMKLAAAVRIIWAYGIEQFEPAGDIHPTITDLDNVLQNNLGLVELTDWVNSFYTKKGFHPSVMWVARYMCDQIDPIKSEEFFRKVVIGIGIVNETDPAYKLREDLLGHERARSDEEGEVRRKSVRSRERFPTLAVIFKAWNDYVSGKAARKRYKWSTEESFPKPINVLI
jgi:hypothetical protein